MIDLRSDTVTVPTDEMRRAMAAAEVGDDVYGEDPTTKRLEELAAEIIGKEAALFVASGTMGNQVAAMTHTRRGDEVLVDAEAHIYYYEVGGLAALSGTQPRPLASRRGRLEPADVTEALRGRNIHFPTPTLLCLENTHNRAGGTVMTARQTEVLAATAHQAGLRIHLDGARIFNAAVALGTTARELAVPADSVMFCLSKGLGAPVGSMLAGGREFIDRARKNRKLLGGGMRQSGVLAAAGIIALTRMVDRLAEDHANARRLAEGLAGLAGLEVDLEAVQTNMVAFDLRGADQSAAAFMARLRELGVLANVMGPRRLRLVTHKEISRGDIDQALGRIARALGRGA